MRALLLIAMLLAGCAPTFERRPSHVDQPRFLAVQVEPPEAAPGARVRFSALLADEAGPRAAAVEWAFCLVNRPAAEPSTVATACMEGEAAALRGFSATADALVAEAALPTEGCKVFGSEPPPPAPGAQPLRPADPDETGGYYQPVRVAESSGPIAFAQARLSCALPSAPASVVQDFKARYRFNRNPQLLGLALEDGAVQVAAGARATLVARWADGDAEPYVAYALATASLEDRVESLRVDWFTTQGALDADSQRELSGTEASVGWLAPEAPGTVHLWAVLRDDRGGMAFRQLEVEVR